MKHKRIITAILVALPLLTFTPSCTDLEETVYSSLAAQDFNPTENDLASLIAPVYVPMRDMMMGWQGYFDVMEEPADIVVTPARPNGWYDGGTYHRMHRHEWTYTQWQPTNLWNNCWSIINNANRVIYQIESGDIPLEGEIYDKTLAELRGVRAWSYYILVDSHGNVPIATDFTDEEPPQQFTRQQVFDFVVTELTDVLDHLETEVNTNSYGRFTKWAALTTLAKLYLNKEVYTGTPDWQKVIDYTQEIIDHAPYMLEDSYKTSFLTDNEGSKEIIWAVPYDDVLATQWSQHMKSLNPNHRLVLNMESQPWGGSCGVPQFINTYDPDDTRKQDTWIMGDQYKYNTDEVLFTYDNYLPSMGGDYGDLPTMENGYRLGKYEIKVGAKAALSNDFVIFRYADILMMKAEALLRMGQSGPAALIVSEVRERAFKDNPSKATVTGAELEMGSSYNYGWYQNGVVTSPEGGADIQYGRFLDELGWEFALEARRRQDLIRFGVFHTKTWMNHNPTSIQKSIFPIPEGAMLTNPNLKQNPGYPGQGNS